METLKFHRIQAWTHPENEASIRLLLKFGFREEGRMARACYLRHRKEWIDIRVFAKLADLPSAP
jgi:RimJ/RimL family protein N-acetyltransferase